MQLEFFPLSKEEQLEIDIKRLKESCEKVRKKLFVQNNELRKMYDELQHEFECLKKNIVEYNEKSSR